MPKCRRRLGEGCHSTSRGQQGLPEKELQEHKVDGGEGGRRAFEREQAWAKLLR